MHAACPMRPTARSELANGIQIFPGSVPIYRGNQLIGGIGVSGDGIDQDDMVSFLGLHNAGLRVGGIGNAPNDIRADRIQRSRLAGGLTRLRYVNCPFAPFLDTRRRMCARGCERAAFILPLVLQAVPPAEIAAGARCASTGPERG